MEGIHGGTNESHDKATAWRCDDGRGGRGGTWDERRREGYKEYKRDRKRGVGVPASTDDTEAPACFDLLPAPGATLLASATETRARLDLSSPGASLTASAASLP